MKKRFAVMFAVLLCVVLLSGMFSVRNSPAGTVVSAAEESAVSGARFLNMLNHNYAYNEAFASFDELAAGAVIANLGYREGDYISEAYIKGYLFDMYGLNAVSFTQDAPEQRPGYIYINPVGYTKYEHTDAAVTENEDGTFTVVTDVKVIPHDSAPYDTVAVTLFAPNKNSAFGYTIVYSNLDPKSVTL